MRIQSSSWGEVKEDKLVERENLQQSYTFHSAAIVNLTKLQKTLMGPAQGEQVCLKDSKYILFEILANRTWKGCTNS